MFRCRHLAASSWLIGLLALGFAAGSLVIGCSASRPADPIPPHESLSIDSLAVDESRQINVYLPPGYGSASESYPVLYMPDGGIGEDFPHIANTVASLIEAGDIAPTLVIGIENTVRRRDLTPGSSTESDGELAPLSDGAAAFRTFIKSELIPEIDRRYRTTGERAIVGESVAGLFVIDTFLREPSLFDRYIAMDPSLWWDSGALVRGAATSLGGLGSQHRSLWFAGSNARDISEQTEALAALLEAHAPPNLRWTYVPRPDEEHSTIFRATKEEAFRWGLWAGR